MQGYPALFEAVGHALALMEPAKAPRCTYHAIQAYWDFSTTHPNASLAAISGMLSGRYGEAKALDIDRLAEAMNGFPASVAYAEFVMRAKLSTAERQRPLPPYSPRCVTYMPTPEFLWEPWPSPFRRRSKARSWACRDVPSNPLLDRRSKPDRPPASGPV